MRIVVAVSVALMIALFIVGYSSAGGEAADQVPQTTCPITGFPIDAEVFADYQGKRVYFCCPGMCEKEFMEDPDRYIRELEEQGVTLEETPELEREGEDAWRPSG